MRIFVCGATGVIGRRAVPLLLAQGHAVTAVAREGPKSEHLRAAGARCVSVDLFDADALGREVDGQDVLINLATHMPDAVWKMMFRSAWRLNDRIRSTGVANLVDAALSCGVRRFIQESFAPTYPDCGDAWIDEHTPLAPSAYNGTVLDAEQSVGRFAAPGTAAAVPAGERTGVVLRFAGFYGPDAMQMKTLVDGLKRGWAALPGSPDRFISSISHDDAATAVVAALRAASGAYNVTDDEPVRRGEYFGALARALGAKAPRFLPPWTTRLFGAVGEALARSLRISNRKLKAETGWTPKFPSVREGWPATLAAMESA